jgi:glycosyltransferase involved in cell wall biosynthesis
LVPYRLTTSKIDKLKVDPRIRHLTTVEPEEPTGDWLRSLALGAPESWLSGASATPVLAGGAYLVSGRFLLAALARGMGHVVCFTGSQFQSVPLWQFPLWHVGRQFRALLLGLSDRPGLMGALTMLRSKRPLRRLWQRRFRAEAPSPGLPGTGDVARAETDYAQFLAPAGTIDSVSDRVVLVNAGLGVGGAETQLLNTAKGLAAAGSEVKFVGEHVFDVTGLSHHAAELRAAGISIDQPRRDRTAVVDALAEATPNQGEALCRLAPDEAIAIAGLAALLAKLRPEIVHAWQDPTNIRAGIAAHIAGIPKIVLSVRGLAPPRALAPGLSMPDAYRALIQSPRVSMIANSKAGAASYSRWLGISEANIGVVYNGIDLARVVRSPDREISDFTTEIGLLPQARLVCGILRDSPAKQPELWLDVAARVFGSLPECHFAILGMDRLPERFAATAAPLVAAGRLHLLGTRNDVAKCLSACDALLVTSESEGTPNAILEAQAVGTAVVSTDVGGVRECVMPGITAWLADQPSAERLATLVLRVLNDRPTTDDDGSPGRRFVHDRFGMARMISDLQGIYDSHPSAP